MIFKFNDFLLEKFGVAESSLIFVDLLFKKCLDRFENYFNIENGDNTLKYVENIRLGSLTPYIKDMELYKDFPVVGFDIEYDFSKYSDYEFRKEYPKTYEKGVKVSVGGYAQSFGHKNWKSYSRYADPIEGVEYGLIIYLGIEIHVNEDDFEFDDPVDMDVLKENIKSTLYHELNHSYESYKLTLKKAKKGEIRKPIQIRSSFNVGVTHAMDKAIGIPDSIWDIWNEKFLFYTYLCEDVELRSHVQEVLYYLKYHPQQDIKENRIFKFYDEMEKFDAKSAYDLFTSKIDALGKFYGNDNVDYSTQTLNRLKECWVKAYERICKQENYKPILPLSTLTKMSCYEFMVWWEKIIKDRGSYVKKKIYKLVSGKDHFINKNNDIKNE